MDIHLSLTSWQYLGEWLVAVSLFPAHTVLTVLETLWNAVSFRLGQ